VNFAVEHSIPAVPRLVAEALLDTEFQDSLDGLGPLSERTVLSQEPHGGGVIRRTRCVLGTRLPGAARRFIGGEDPSWVEEAIWDPAALRWTWVVIPEVGGDLLRARGRIDLIADGAATLRRVAGSVRVGVPIFGGRVESAIVAGLEGAYAEEASRLAAWLGARGRDVTPP
jgi:hypothetical protein